MQEKCGKSNKIAEFPLGEIGCGWWLRPRRRVLNPTPETDQVPTMYAGSTRPRMRRLLPFVSAAFALAIIAVPATARANPEAYKKTLKSTCWIVRPAGEITYFGTGVLVDRDRRLVVSNQHVVDEDREVLLFFPQKKDGEVITEKRWYYE